MQFKLTKNLSNILYFFFFEWENFCYAINNYKLGVGLKEVKDWVCCGTTPAHSTSHLLATALPARTLVNAKQESLGEILVPCASCFQRLKVAAADLDELALLGNLVGHAHPPNEVDRCIRKRCGCSRGRWQFASEEGESSSEEMAPRIAASARRRQSVRRATRPREA